MDVFIRSRQLSPATPNVTPLTKPTGQPRHQLSIGLKKKRILKCQHKISTSPNLRTLFIRSSVTAPKPSNKVTLVFLCSLFLRATKTMTIYVAVSISLLCTRVKFPKPLLMANRTLWKLSKVCRCWAHFCPLISFRLLFAPLQFSVKRTTQRCGTHLWSQRWIIW